LPLYFSNDCCLRCFVVPKNNPGIRVKGGVRERPQVPIMKIGSGSLSDVVPSRFKTLVREVDNVPHGEQLSDLL
jgi:hypothetical protein